MGNRVHRLSPQVCITLPSRVHAEGRAIAEERGVSFSKFISILILAVSNKDSRPRTIGRESYGQGEERHVHAGSYSIPGQS